MKIKITSIFKNTVTKVLANTPSAKLERKVDIYLMIVNRNKLVAPATTSIDDIVAYSKTMNLKYHIYY